MLKEIGRVGGQQAAGAIRDDGGDDFTEKGGFAGAGRAVDTDEGGGGDGRGVAEEGMGCGRRNSGEEGMGCGSAIFKATY